MEVIAQQALLSDVRRGLQAAYQGDQGGQRGCHQVDPLDHPGLDLDHQEALVFGQGDRQQSDP